MGDTGLKEGRINSLRFRRQSISGFVAPADTPGKDTYIASQDAGADGGANPRGGDIVWQLGAGTGTGRDGIFEVQGQGKFTLGITFGGAELVVGASNVLHLGASGGVPTYATNSGDTYVKQILEVGGNLYARATLYVAGTAHSFSANTWDLADRKTFQTTGFQLRGDAPVDQVTIGLSAAGGRQLVICDSASYYLDFDHAVQTNPTQFYHSVVSPQVDNRQYGYTTHNQTAFIIGCGAGYHYFYGDALADNGTLTFTDQPSALESFVVNVTTFTEGTDWSIGGTLSDTLDNIVIAVNGSGEAYTAHKNGNTIVIEKDATGAAGEVFTEAMTNCTITGGGVFTGGRAAVSGTPSAGVNHYFPGIMQVDGTIQAEGGVALNDDSTLANTKNLLLYATALVYVTLDGDGYQGMLMTTDVAAPDVTFKGFSALPAAAVNQGGGSYIIQPGANATGGGNNGTVQLNDADGGLVASVDVGAFTVVPDLHLNANLLFDDTSGASIIYTGRSPGVARAINFSIPIDPGGAAAAALDFQFKLNGTLEAGLLGETDGASHYREPVFKVPYMTADYGAAWAGYTPPTPVSLTDGCFIFAYNSNAGVLASRMYAYLNSAWTFVDL